jgi:hypothetical protein
MSAPTALLDTYPNLIGTLQTMSLFPRIWGAIESLEHTGERIGPIKLHRSIRPYRPHRSIMNPFGKERQAKILPKLYLFQFFRSPAPSRPITSVQLTRTGGVLAGLRCNRENHPGSAAYGS